MNWGNLALAALSVQSLKFRIPRAPTMPNKPEHDVGAYIRAQIKTEKRLGTYV
jgi:hypothetical protein